MRQETAAANKHRVHGAVI